MQAGPGPLCKCGSDDLLVTAHGPDWKGRVVCADCATAEELRVELAHAWAQKHEADALARLRTRQLEQALGPPALYEARDVAAVVFQKDPTQQSVLRMHAALYTLFDDRAKKFGR